MDREKRETKAMYIQHVYVQRQATVKSPINSPNVGSVMLLTPALHYLYHFEFEAHVTDVSAMTMLIIG